MRIDAKRPAHVDLPITVRGFIIDEAFMADEELMFTVINICFQLPLLEELRRPGAIPLSVTGMSFYSATFANSHQPAVDNHSGRQRRFNRFLKFLFYARIDVTNEMHR